MILLIDGYNVLKQVFPAEIVGQRERKRFIEHLGKYGKKRQHKVVLVFDGGPYERDWQEKVAGVYVVYSGTLETADDYIRRYLEKNKKLDLLLISSDRELRSAAARLNIESMHSPEFYKMVVATLRSGSKKTAKETEVVKTSEGKNVQLDEIMREGSKKVPSKVEDLIRPERSRKSKAHQPKKKERKKLKKLKKL